MNLTSLLTVVVNNSSISWNGLAPRQLYIKVLSSDKTVIYVYKFNVLQFL